MTTPKHYQALSQEFQRIYHFQHLQALGDWDQATMMPMGGSRGRADAMAELAVHIHQLKTSPHLLELLDSADSEPLTPSQRANLTEMRYQTLQATALPSTLVQAKTQLTYQCEHAWRDQRKNNDWQGFAPNLTAVIDLVREEAQILGEAQGLSPYDALLNKFEPGTQACQIEQVFNEVKTWLPDLIKQVQQHQASRPHLTIPACSVDKQQALSLDVMSLLGFDFNQGRLDVSSHPFSGGVPGDQRITTRYEEQDFLSALFSTIHETGHARYEQGLPLEWRGQPAGQARSMAIHESQSLFFEMQLARGKGLLSPLTAKVNQHLGTQFTATQLEHLTTQVTPGFIRVDADEVTYPCHIMLRFDAEKALVDGSLSVADLPDFWDKAMQSLLGLSTKDNNRNGCMQDIHWPVGELGYFPSYTLGAMYAAQLRGAIEAQLGNIDQLVSDGKLNRVFEWLQHNIWSKGSLLTTNELITAATGESLNPQHFKRHLFNRYL